MTAEKLSEIAGRMKAAPEYGVGEQVAVEKDRAWLHAELTAALERERLVRKALNALLVDAWSCRTETLALVNAAQATERGGDKP